MPKRLEQRLKAEYRKQRRKGRLKRVTEGQYVYGALRKRGWKRK